MLVHLGMRIVWCGNGNKHQSINLSLIGCPSHWRSVVGKLTKNVNFVNPQSVNESVSFVKVNKLTFLSNAEV